jgi:hypothetical protein
MPRWPRPPATFRDRSEALAEAARLLIGFWTARASAMGLMASERPA